ncbi:hypothetical protein [Mesorhizobium sp. B2-7-1]|uniref:hypothetical protein n=1 Tax=Mesorhizobium sp. B2-7-1 TaxID=2589909 RepID=UPI0015E317E8|nr:hypothetical protein [Mesorhizobium sp. B2-7-1]
MPEKLDDEEKRMLTRRYFRSESMRRYLRSLPIFATERWLPEPGLARPQLKADLMELCAFVGARRNQLLFKPRNVFPDCFRVGNPLLPALS